MANYKRLHNTQTQYHVSLHWKDVIIKKQLNKSTRVKVQLHALTYLHSQLKYTQYFMSKHITFLRQQRKKTTHTFFFTETFFFVNTNL